MKASNARKPGRKRAAPVGKAAPRDRKEFVSPAQHGGESVRFSYPGTRVSCTPLIMKKVRDFP